MTVSPCIRQGSKRNDDSVSVEELDWSAESPLNTSGVSLNADLEPKTSPNTNDLYIWIQSFQNYCNRDGNTIFKYINYVSIFVATVLKWLYPYVQVIGVWWWVFGSFKDTPEVFSCFLQTSQVLPHWLNHHFSYTQRHCHVRIEKGSVQTVAIKLEEHNSLEYHYMLKH